MLCSFSYSSKKRTWKSMSGYERKQGYREYDAAIARGLKPPKKP